MRKTIFTFLLILGILFSDVYSQVLYKRFNVERSIKTNVINQNVYLFVRPQQQRATGARGQCQATCASMILSYDRIRITPNQIELNATGRIGSAPAMTTIVNSIVNRLRYPMMTSRFEPRYSYTSHLIDFFRELINNNVPCYFLAYGHAWLVQGYDDRIRTLYVTDPAQPVHNVLTFNYENFMKWIENSNDYKFTQKIFVAHKRVRLVNFTHLPKQGNESSETFIYNKDWRLSETPR